MILEINEKTKEGKNLATFLRGIAKNNTYIKLISDKESDEFEDQELGKLMEKSRTGKLLSENEKANFLKKLQADAE